MLTCVRGRLAVVSPITWASPPKVCQPCGAGSLCQVIRFVIDSQVFIAEILRALPTDKARHGLSRVRLNTGMVPMVLRFRASMQYLARLTLASPFCSTEPLRIVRLCFHRSVAVSHSGSAPVGESVAPTPCVALGPSSGPCVPHDADSAYLDFGIQGVRDGGGMCPLIQHLRAEGLLLARAASLRVINTTSIQYRKLWQR